MVGESFNATVPFEYLGGHWFLDLDDARQKVEEAARWRVQRPEILRLTCPILGMRLKHATKD